MAYIPIHRYKTSRYHAPGPDTEPNLWPYLTEVSVSVIGDPPHWVYVEMYDYRDGRGYLFSFGPDAPGAERWIGEHRA